MSSGYASDRAKPTPRPVVSQGDAAGLASDRETSGPNAAGHEPTGRDATGHDATGHDATGHDATGHDATGHNATLTPPSNGPVLLADRGGTRRRVPTHFFVGTLLLYSVVLGTFLLNASPSLREMRPNWRTIVPVAAGTSFYVSANLFLLILGRGRVSRWTVLKCTAATLVATAALCLALRASMLFERTPPDAHLLRGIFDGLARFVSVVLSGESALARMLKFAAMICVEELIKLLPVFVLIARGRITSAHAAMLCGAIAGLTFGTVESISYGYLSYAEMRQPVPTYLTRFFIMAPLHGIWDALAGGLVFFLSGRGRSNTRRRPGAWAFGAGFASAVVFHVLHNALQEVVGPVMQIVTVFSLLAPMYVLAKLARRQATAEGIPDTGQLVGDLHVLTIAMATLFLAAGVTFSWLLGLHTPRHDTAHSSVLASTRMEQGR